MTKIAVILCGCGHLDGSEIREAVLTLLELDKAGAEAHCFAPAEPQTHVVNHLLRQESAGETRVMLDEAARIARGAIRPLGELRPEEMDGMVIPGGYGAAKNLCDVAFRGKEASFVHPDFQRAAQAFVQARKPVGAICIAPALLTLALRGDYCPRVTIGEDPDGLIAALGGEHVRCPVTEFVEDPNLRLFSTPAYMYDARLKDAAQGIAAMTAALVSQANLGRSSA